MDGCVRRRLSLCLSTPHTKKVEPVLTKLPVLLWSVSLAHPLLAILVLTAKIPNMRIRKFVKTRWKMYLMLLSEHNRKAVGSLPNGQSPVKLESSVLFPKRLQAWSLEAKLLRRKLHKSFLRCWQTIEHSSQDVLHPILTPCFD